NLKSRVHELVWKKSVVIVGKERLQLDGAGGWVNLIIDCQKVSGGEAVLQRAVVRLDGQPNTTLELVEHRWNVVLRDSKHNRDWLELCDHNQAGGVSRLHEVPRIDQAQPDPPADRRGDAGVDKLHFDTLDQSLVVFDGAFELVHKGSLRIVLLPWNCILLDEHCETLEIEARVVQQSLVTRQLSVELGQLGLELVR